MSNFYLRKIVYCNSKIQPEVDDNFVSFGKLKKG